MTTSRAGGIEHSVVDRPTDKGQPLSPYAIWHTCKPRVFRFKSACLARRPLYSRAFRPLYAIDPTLYTPMHDDDRSMHLGP